MADGVLQHFVETESAVRLEDRLPRIDRARHRNGMRRCRRNLARQACREHALGGGSRRRAARAVVAPYRRIRLRHEAEAVAADAGHRRLDHAQRRDSRDGSIGGRAASLEYVDRRDARERMGGRGHSLARVDGRAAGEMKIA